MEARQLRPLMGAATILLFGLNSIVNAQFMRAREHVAHSQNFIVFASSPEWAAQVAQVAEQNRRDLAKYWLGKELPNWSERCPIHVQSSPQLGAGGETRFSLLPGARGGSGVGNWMMIVQGTRKRILDSVLPHEITHTIFATHFAHLGKYVPRWADEGACTTVEHPEEKGKHAHFLQDFLRHGRGLSFNRMFSLKEYPEDILPLYAQGHSAVQFLLDQGGPRKFIAFLEEGMQTGAWERVLREKYTYRTIGQFQTLWNQWLIDGSPSDLTAYAPGLAQGDNTLLASNTANPTSLDGKVQFAIGNTRPAPTMLAGNSTPKNAAFQNSIAASNHGSTTTGSWYKRRLREFSQGGPPTDASPVVAAPANGHGAVSVNQQTVEDGRSPVYPNVKLDHSLARPQPSTRPSIRVLDWGDSAPIQGIAPSQQIEATQGIEQVEGIEMPGGTPVDPSTSSPSRLRSVTNVEMVPLVR